MCRTQCALALVALYVGLAQSWDIAVGYGDLLELYTNKTKTVTVRFESQNLAALAYDEVHNMMLYVDKQSGNDAICGYDISSMQFKYFTERNGRNIHGLAFDPATELLFFTDTNERSINWLSLKLGSQNNVNGNVLIKMDDGIPTDIAVDSCRGYVYWINTNLTKPTIKRARFNGSEREVVINLSSLSVNTTYKLESHSLAIDQQAQRIYWFEPTTSLKYNIHSADLNGKNRNIIIYYTLLLDGAVLSNLSNTLTVSKTSLFMAGWYPKANVWEFPKTFIPNIGYNPVFKLNNKIPAAIAFNYKLEDQIQEIQNCKTLTSLLLNNSVTVGPFCVHGMKVNGQSVCKCSPGYTGERCDVLVCENYCVQGNCSFNVEGLPKCSCNAGYSGERCEVSACNSYCLNSGDCSLNEEYKPVCLCKGDYVGDRCDVSQCLNYCFQGNCSFNDDGYPQCSCNAGYSGERCEVNACNGYCLNNGDCSLSEEDEPVCQCVGDNEGSRCEAVKNYTFTNPSTPTYYSVQRNLTLADIFSNWRKPVTKMTVILESS